MKSTKTSECKSTKLQFFGLTKFNSWNLFAKQSPKRFGQIDEERELLMNISMKEINFFSIHKGSISCWCTSQFSSYKSTVIPHINFHLSSGPRVTFHVPNENIMRSTTMKKENRFPDPRILIFFHVFCV